MPSAHQLKAGGARLARMLSVKVSTKHQVSIPSSARRRLGIQAGDRLSVEITEDGLILRRRSARPSERLRGLGSEAWKGVDPVAHVRHLREESERNTATANDRE
jgi:AbrB family looped-hinge helix DNA binding protein